MAQQEILVTPRQFATKKATREAGYATCEEWCRRAGRPYGEAEFLVSRRDAQPVVVKGESFYCEADCEQLVTRGEMSKRLGLSVPDTAEPVYWRRGEHSSYPLFRVSDCIPRRKCRVVPPREIDTLLATFTVNRTAKRCRDAAKGHYSGKRFGLATHAREQKENLYDLKERGIIAAYLAGRLQCVGIHGELGLYRGEGYCFHSPLIPADVEFPETEVDGDSCFVEAAPKGTGEARLKDAVHTLEMLDSDDAGFRSVGFPRIAPDRLTAEEERMVLSDEDEIDDDDGDHDEGEYDEFEEDWKEYWEGSSSRA